MKHVILFTGHMIDENDRVEPRFPASKEIAVKAAILKELIDLKAKTKQLLAGIAGGACGGDILFHEICKEKEIDIPTEMYLALPPKEYKERSVSFAGPEWVTRFDLLTKKLIVNILPKSKNIDKQNNIWEMTNLWMLDNALHVEGKNMTLLALWDGIGGDGNGGTEHMINIAKDKGAKIIIININKV
jgi:hypothetical protein